MRTVRSAAVAGSFYPAEPEVLGGMVDCLLRDVNSSQPSMRAWAYVVPHAGYVYSGSTAAHVYARIAAAAQVEGLPARVVILGPTHRVYVDGVARAGTTAFATPLGEAEVDTDAERRLDALPFVVTAPEVHELEHSIEVQVPFVQRVLPGVPIVPLAVGGAPPEQVAAVIETLVGEPERGNTLVLVSSDLSHYLPYEEAQRVDAATLRAVCSVSDEAAVPFITHEQACGATPLNGLLAVAARRGLRPEVLAACNSGDTAGDGRRVVGYAAIALPESR
ncbi:MAG: AmmeMemoRadiSam system protein B [Dermatophilus congolensis]|nr:AmmeMemoRadiSam system protein B [Dermatophilus congolensis]